MSLPSGSLAPQHASRMRAEALQAPQVAAQLLAADDTLYRDLAHSLQQHPPRAVLTVARGSSDHAAQYLAYLVMARWASW